MKKIIMFLMCLLCGVVTAQTWEEIGINLPDGEKATDATQIAFSTKDIGWLATVTVSGKSKIYKTTDAGKNWLEKGKYASYAMSAFSIGENYFWLLSPIGWIVYTKDGGDTWYLNGAVGSTYIYPALYFFDEKRGFAFGENCWVTTDGGMNWDMKDGKLNSPPQDAFFYNEKIGWAVGHYGDEGGYIAKTTDGGNSWVYQDTRLSSWSHDKFGIDFIDSSKGIAAGTIVKKTTDGGKTWQSLSGVSGYDVGYLDEKNVWVSSGSQIYSSYDGGETWKKSFNTSVNYILDKIIILKKDKTGYALGINPIDKTATLYKADLSTVTGIEKKEVTIPAQFSLSQNYPNPFNPTTIIQYSIPVETRRGESLQHVTLKVYDMLGREVATLVNEYKQAGTYQVKFSVETFHGTSLPSGIYFYTLRAGNGYSETKKMVLTK